MLHLGSFDPCAQTLDQAFYPHGNLQDLLDRDTNLGENHTLQVASEMVSLAKRCVCVLSCTR